MNQTSVTAALRAHRDNLAPVLDFDLAGGDVVVFDFTAANTELSRLDINDVAGFTESLFERIIEADTPVGIGRYDEDRVLYRHSPLGTNAPQVAWSCRPRVGAAGFALRMRNLL